MWMVEKVFTKETLRPIRSGNIIKYVTCMCRLCKYTHITLTYNLNRKL